jgi:hypothetical protein
VNAKSGVLTHVPEAFIAREIFVFLATLVVAYHGCEVTTKSDGASSNECRSKKRGLQERHMRLINGCRPLPLKVCRRGVGVSCLGC